VAISDLLRAGHGSEYTRPDPLLAELAAWVAHRQRRVEARTALKNQLLGQVDRAVPGLSGCIRRPLGSKVGRLVLAQFTDPGRLARLEPAQVRAEAAAHGVQLHPAMAHCLVSTARVALVAEPVGTARLVLAQDLDVLEVLEAQVHAAEQRLAALVERTRFAVLTTTPGWSAVRAAAYAAAVGDLARWPSHRQVYRAAGLPRWSTPRPDAGATDPSAGKARSSCVGPCSALVWACGATMGRHGPGRPSCALAARPPAWSPPRWPTGPAGSPLPWSAINSPTNPTVGGNRQATTAWSGRVGGSVGRPELTPPAALAGPESRRGKLGARPPATPGARTRSAGPAQQRRPHTSA
jgi:transposase